MSADSKQLTGMLSWPKSMEPDLSFPLSLQARLLAATIFKKVVGRHMKHLLQQVGAPWLRRCLCLGQLNRGMHGASQAGLPVCVVPAALQQRA